MAEPTDTVPLDAPSHLTLILDLSPKQWHLSSLESNDFPLSLDAFLPQVLTFVNAHLAGRHDNTVTVFGAFPGTRLVCFAYVPLLSHSLTRVSGTAVPCCVHPKTPSVHRLGETQMFITLSEPSTPPWLGGSETTWHLPLKTHIFVRLCYPHH